ncbi:MAG: hypothetical protein P8Y68_09915, partial [Anaerolineales bacterium]
MAFRLKKFSLYIKAFRQLGWRTISPYISYQIQCRLGSLKRKTPLISYAQAAENAGELDLP